MSLDGLLIESCVDRGTLVRPPVPRTLYVSFVDPSGGAYDSFTAAVAHVDGDMAILDCLIEVKAPCNPVAAASQISAVLKTYGIHSTVADKFGSGFAVDAFGKEGIRLDHSEHDRSQLYLECMPLLTSGRVRLLDNRRLVAQFGNLERRSFSSGKQVIDHGVGGHDDLANAVAGALVLAAGKGVNFMSLITNETLARARVPSLRSRLGSLA